MVNLKKEKTLEELQDEFNSLSRKRNQLILDADKVTKELVELAEKVYEASPEYVKVICPNCNGTTVVESQTEEGKKVKCMCYPKGYLFMKKHKEVKTNDN